LGGIGPRKGEVGGREEGMNERRGENEERERERERDV
jgi:hypothetical protein